MCARTLVNARSRGRATPSPPPPSGFHKAAVSGGQPLPHIAHPVIYALLDVNRSKERTILDCEFRVRQSFPAIKQADRPARFCNSLRRSSCAHRFGDYEVTTRVCDVSYAQKLWSIRAMSSNTFYYRALVKHWAKRTGY